MRSLRAFRHRRCPSPKTVPEPAIRRRSRPARWPFPTARAELPVVSLAESDQARSGAQRTLYQTVRRKHAQIGSETSRAHAECHLAKDRDAGLSVPHTEKAIPQTRPQGCGIKYALVVLIIPKNSFSTESPFRRKRRLRTQIFRPPRARACACARNRNRYRYRFLANEKEIRVRARRLFTLRAFAFAGGLLVVTSDRDPRARKRARASRPESSAAGANGRAQPSAGGTAAAPIVLAHDTPRRTCDADGR